MFATPLVNLPVFITFVWSIRGMLRDGTVPGLDTGEADTVHPCFGHVFAHSYVT